MNTFDSLSDLVDSFENAWDVPVARETGATFDGGVQVSATWTASVIERCVIVPAGRGPLVFEGSPAGYSKKGDIQLFVRSQYAPGSALYDDAQETRRPDVIEWQGALYRVDSVNDWRGSADVIDAMLLRLDRPERSVAEYVAAMTRSDPYA